MPANVGQCSLYTNVCIRVVWVYGQKEAAFQIFVIAVALSKPFFQTTDRIKTRRIYPESPNADSVKEVRQGCESLEKDINAV